MQQSRPATRTTARLGLAGALLAVFVAGCAGQVPTQAEVKQQNADAKAAQMLRVAETTARGGDLATAAGLYKRAAMMAPNDPLPLVGLADTLALAGHNRDAVEAYRGALALAPDNIDAHYGYGRVLLSMNRPDLAVVELEAVASARTQEVTVLNVLGIALDLTNAHEAAQARYRQALTVKPDHPASRNNLGLSQALAGDYDAAIATMRALANDPIASPRHRLNLALVYGLAGRPDDARRVASRLLGSIDVENNVAYYDRLRHMTPRERATAVFGVGR